MAINLYLGDCMDAMKSMKENQYDLAIVDPPYGIGIDGNTTVDGISGKARTFRRKQHHIKKGWDMERPSSNYFNILTQISKNRIIWGGNYYADLLPPSKGWVFWDKKITNINNKNFSDGELAWTSFDCILRRFAYDWIGFGYLNNPQNEKKIHPTQKPVKLYEWLLMNYAKPGQKILDTHGGSMSIALAVHNVNEREGMNLSLDLWEIDEEYYKAGVERYQRHIAQTTIFTT